MFTNNYLSSLNLSGWPGWIFHLHTLSIFLTLHPPPLLFLWANYPLRSHPEIYCINLYTTSTYLIINIFISNKFLRKKIMHWFYTQVEVQVQHVYRFSKFLCSEVHFIICTLRVHTVYRGKWWQKTLYFNHIRMVTGPICFIKIDIKTLFTQIKCIIFHPKCTQRLRCTLQVHN